MSFKFSTGLRNYIAVTGSLRAALGSCVLKAYAGTEPASADAALGGATLLYTISTGGDGTTPLAWEPVAADGVLTKETSDVWEGEAVADGTQAFFRLETVADAGTSSTSAVRIQGNIKLAGGDMNMSSLTVVDGSTQTLDNGAIAIPAQ